MKCRSRSRKTPTKGVHGFIIVINSSEGDNRLCCFCQWDNRLYGQPDLPTYVLCLL